MNGSRALKNWLFAPESYFIADYFADVSDSYDIIAAKDSVQPRIHLQGSRRR
jgi:hypothetical protein